MSSIEKTTDPSAEAVEPSVLATVSREMVRIYKEQFGRGPTRVRSNWAGSDTLVCILENTFTPAERNLRSMGEHQRLRDTRLFFQYATTAEFTQAVERATGRTVRSFISGIDTNTDVACELFVLEPDVAPNGSEPAEPSPAGRAADGTP